MTTPAWVDDGRPSRVTTVSELQPGDVILPWQGEPWSWTVERIEREPVQSFGTGPIRYRFTIHYSDGTPSLRYVQGDAPRRVLSKEG